MFTYVWIALALLAGGVAYRKGRGPVVWFLLSWAITPVLALALVLWKAPCAEGLALRRFARGERKCPACGTFAPRTTTTCPTCSAPLPSVPAASDRRCPVPTRPPACVICGATAFREAPDPTYFTCAVCDQDYELARAPGAKEAS